jgi:hypothetical protein
MSAGVGGWREGQTTVMDIHDMAMVANELLRSSFERVAAARRERRACGKR